MEGCSFVSINTCMNSEAMSLYICWYVWTIKFFIIVASDTNICTHHHIVHKWYIDEFVNCAIIGQGNDLSLSHYLNQ